MSLGGHALRGSALAIVGYGSVGKKVAGRVARALGSASWAIKARPQIQADQGFRFENTGDPDGSIPRSDRWRSVAWPRRPSGRRTTS